MAGAIGSVGKVRMVKVTKSWRNMTIVWTRSPPSHLFLSCRRTESWGSIPAQVPEFETRQCSSIFKFKLNRGAGKSLGSNPDSAYLFSSCSWTKSLGSIPAQVPEFETRQCSFIFKLPSDRVLVSPWVQTPIALIYFQVAVGQSHWVWIPPKSLSSKPVNAHLFSSCRRIECWLVPGFKPRHALS